MKLFQIENNYNYTAKCINCPSLLKFNIDINNLIINGECKNGHNFYDIKPCQLSDFIKNTYFSKNYCYKCQSKLNIELKNFFCINCNKLYCKNCINNHSQEKNHKINLFNINFRFCSIHNSKNILFCDNCKTHICEECKSMHESHCLLPFLEITPHIKKKMIISKIDEYKKSINNLLNFILKKKEEIDKRFEKLNNFLNNLLYINEKLLKKYNNSIFDYYNYHNFYQFFNYQYNESCFDESKNLNYLLFGNNSNDNIDVTNKNEKTEKIFINKAKENFNICNYKNLKYLKDNIFFLCEQKDGKILIKFFEFIDCSFQLNFSQLLGNCDKINSIKIGNYNNIFIMTRGNRIFKIKYDLEEKKAFMTKLYDPYHKKHFHDVIDTKNDNFILCNPKGLKVFKDFYSPENIVHNINNEYYTLLYNINDFMFLCEGKNCIYYFYNSEKYEKIKSICFPLDFKYEGRIKNDLLIFTQKFMCFYLVSTKYIEIVQKFDYLKSNRFVTIDNNNLYELYFDNDNIEIKKYDIEKGCFNDLVIVKTGRNDISLKNIKLIDDNYVFLAIEEEFEIYNY